MEKHEQLVELLTAHQGRVFGYIFALVRNRADAEDLFQQTMLVLWSKFDQYQADTNFVRWACATAQFEVLNFLKRKRRSRVNFSEPLLEQLAELQVEMVNETDDARQAALARCMQNLTALDRQLIQRCYGDEQPARQLAEELGRPQRSIHNSLRRIRLALLDCIERKMAARGDA